MLEVVSALILYVCSLPCLYGILRLAVRHGIQDIDHMQHEAALRAQERAARQAEERAALQARTAAPENAYLTGS